MYNSVKASGKTSPNLVAPDRAESNADPNADIFAYRQNDLRQNHTVRLTNYPSTHHNTFQWLGPREVNYNYYVSWIGKDRILLLPAQAANQMGLIKALARSDF